jgi:hypothetical protein
LRVRVEGSRQLLPAGERGGGRGQHRGAVLGAELPQRARVAPRVAQRREGAHDHHGHVGRGRVALDVAQGLQKRDAAPPFAEMLAMDVRDDARERRDIFGARHHGQRRRQAIGHVLRAVGVVGPALLDEFEEGHCQLCAWVRRAVRARCRPQGVVRCRDGHAIDARAAPRRPTPCAPP